MKNKRIREKRIRPEKIISEGQFLGLEERRTKEDLPTELSVVSNPHKTKKTRSEPKVNGLTKKYLGHGKRPKWMDCPEREVNENGMEKEKTEKKN